MEAEVAELKAQVQALSISLIRVQGKLVACCELNVIRRADSRRRGGNSQSSLQIRLLSG